MNLRVLPITATSRSTFLTALLLTSFVKLCSAGDSEVSSETRIDRRALVTRHSIAWDEVAGRLPLGNGEFCFGADGTGSQTFAGNSMSHWGWHSFPLPDGWTPERVPPTGTFQKGRNVGGDEFPPGTESIRQWMFDNPHIMNLGRLRLLHPDGRALTPGEIGHLERSLDLWTGVQSSHYEVAGQKVKVETCVHPKLDLVAVQIESPLVASGELEVGLDFAYPTLNNGPWAGDFTRASGHTTTASRHGEALIQFVRKVDAVTYYAALAASPGCSIRLPEPATGPGKLDIQHAEYGAGDKWADVTAKVASAVVSNQVTLQVNYRELSADPAPGKAKRIKVTYLLDGQTRQTEVADNQTLSLPAAVSRAYYVSARGRNVMACVCAFSATPLPARLPGFEETRVACAAHWESFWRSGGAIDLSVSKDPRWRELERRIVLSQYLMAVMSAGSWPSSENGLLGMDPWRGQFHMEMVWWHLAHYALWDRWEMADKAIGCYRRFAPAARNLPPNLVTKD